MPRQRVAAQLSGTRTDWHREDTCVFDTCGRADLQDAAHTCSAAFCATVMEQFKVVGLLCGYLLADLLVAEELCG
eukprot:113688-Amphidinium_carterae.1